MARGVQDDTRRPFNLSSEAGCYLLVASRRSIPFVMELVWHYTVRLATHLGRILDEGVIHREDETGRPLPRKYQMPLRCVWFSSNQFWEPTATRRIGENEKELSREAAQQRTMEIAARIGVLPDVAPVTRQNYKLRVRAFKSAPRRDRERWEEMLVGLEDVAREAGANLSDFFASLDPVKRPDWQRVEILADGVWRAVDTDKRDYILTAEPKRPS